MKLHRKNISLLDDCCEFRAVGAGGCGRTGIKRRVGVRKIEIRSEINTCEKGRLALLLNLVPTHVRELHDGAPGGGDSREKPQAPELRTLSTRIKEHPPPG